MVCSTHLSSEVPMTIYLGTESLMNSKDFWDNTWNSILEGILSDLRVG